MEMTWRLNGNDRCKNWKLFVLKLCKLLEIVIQVFYLVSNVTDGLLKMHWLNWSWIWFQTQLKSWQPWVSSKLMSLSQEAN